MAVSNILRGRESELQTSKAILDIWGVRIDTGLPTLHDRSLFSQIIPAKPAYFDMSVNCARITLEDYPPEMIARSGLKVIKFADQLMLPPDLNHQYDYPVSGCVSFKKGIIYAATDPYAEETLHHEIGHLLDYALPPKIREQFDDGLEAINQRFSIDYDQRNNSLYHRPFGFVTPYSGTDIKEDIPEIISVLMTGPYELFNITENDPALTAKVDLTFDFLDIASNNALSADWRKIKENYQPFRFLQLYTGFTD